MTIKRAAELIGILQNAKKNEEATDLFHFVAEKLALKGKKLVSFGKHCGYKVTFLYAPERFTVFHLFKGENND